MRIWSKTTEIADAEAQAATVDDAGRARFFFQSDANRGFVASELAVDRFGAVTGAQEQVLGVGYDDQSLPVIYGNDALWRGEADLPIMEFTFALPDADGATLLFSLNERATYAEDGEFPPFDEYPWSESWLTSRFLTAYRLGGGSPDENGFVPYDDYAFVARGQDSDNEYIQVFEVHDPENGEYYPWEFHSGNVGSTEFLQPSVLAFDGGHLLASYRLDVKADGDYYTDIYSGNPVHHTYHVDTSQISYQFIDMAAPSQPAAVVLDDTPVGNSVVIDRPADQLGVLWINSAGSTAFRLSLASVGNAGAVARTFKADIAASSLEGAPTLGAMTVLGAAAAADGSIVAVIENDGRPYLARFDRGLHLQGTIASIAGGRWSGVSREHASQIGIVPLADGGFVLALSLETDETPGGADHRLLVQQYDANGVAVDRPMRIAADGKWFNLADLGNGRLSLAWTDGGKTCSEILDTRASGLNLTGSEGADALIGTALADRLEGGDGDDRTVGGGGNDWLYGGTGNDLLIGGDGADRLFGGEGRDVARYDKASVVDLLDRSLNAGEARGDVLYSIEQLRGSFEADSFYGSDAADILEGNGGDDILVGRGGNDKLYGREGDDMLEGGAGNDTLTGGDGSDTARYVSAAVGVTVSLAIAGAQNTVGAGNDTLIGIENLIGSAFDDSLTGDAGGNVLEGGAGDDALDGGDGNDTASYAAATARVLVSLAVAGAQDTVGAGSDTLIGIENLIGSPFKDSLTGDAADNVLEGGAGDDRLEGGDGQDTGSYASASAGVKVSLSIVGVQDTVGAGNDRLIGIENLAGSALDDRLTGDAGDNVLLGGAGDDRLAGGGGHDTLIGGPGDDMFVFNQALVAGNVTTIGDFAHGGDVVALWHGIFTQVSPIGPLGDQAFAMGPGASSAAVTPFARIIYDTTSGALLYDPDGGGTQSRSQFATVSPGTILSAGDFAIF